MNGRDRLIDALELKQPDRVPVVVWGVNPFNPGWMADDPTFAELLQVVANQTEVFCSCPVERGFLGCDPASLRLTTRTWRADGATFVETTIQAGGRSLRRVDRRDPGVATGWVVEPLIKDDADLAAFLALRSEPARPDLSDFFAMRRQLGSAGLMHLNFDDPILEAVDLLGPELAAIVAVEQPALFAALLDHLWEMLAPFYQAVLADQLLEFAHGLGLDVAHFGRENLASLDEAYLLAVKRRADELGLLVEVGMGSIDRFSTSFRPEDGSGEEQLTAMLEAARTVGSTSVRCLIGGDSERRGPIPLSAHIAECVRVLRAVVPRARDLGVMIAVENHGRIDLLARELRALVEEAGPDHVGVCLDSGNPVYAAEDPLLTTELLAPYAWTTHLRDSRVWATDKGAMVQWVPMGQGHLDLRRMAAILAERAPGDRFVLEIITGQSPLLVPYLDPESDFWKLYPDMPARDLARFVALAARGRPQPLDQLTLPAGVRVPPPERAAEFVAQQRRHFAESARYCREVLGIGERGR